MLDDPASATRRALISGVAALALTPRGAGAQGTRPAPAPVFPPPATDASPARTLTAAPGTNPPEGRARRADPGLVLRRQGFAAGGACQTR